MNRKLKNIDMMRIVKSIILTIQIRTFILRGLLVFLWRMKMWWAIPMVVVLALFFLLLLAAQSTPLGPLIYTIF